jgi:hypothetical protein
MQDGERIPDPGAERLSFTDRWIAPFVREPLLWPVTAVLVAHAVAFLAPIQLLALRDRRLAALAALALLLVLSGTAVRKEIARLHHPGLACALLGVVWGLAAVLAVVADRTGIF